MAQSLAVVIVSLRSRILQSYATELNVAQSAAAKAKLISMHQKNYKRLASQLFRKPCFETAGNATPRDLSNLPWEACTSDGSRLCAKSEIVSHLDGTRVKKLL